MTIPLNGKPDRHSIRLQDYDYSQEGAYFVTLVMQDRQGFFGTIVNETMLLNPAGEMVREWWQNLPGKFPGVELGMMVIMPNHFHGIVFLRGSEAGSQVSLSRVIQWFKTMTTNAYMRGVKNGLWMPFTRRLWQRNYFEHIIRNQEDLRLTWEYIEVNPSQWQDDPENRLINP